MRIPFFRNFSPLTQLFTVFSMHFMGYILASFFIFLIVKPLWGTNILTNPEVLMNFNDPAVLQLNRLTIIISILFVFIMPAMIFRRFMELEGQDYLVIRKKPKLKMVGIITLLLLICFPAANFLFFINTQLDFAFISPETAANLKAAEQETSKYNIALLYNQDFSIYIINLFAIAILTAIGEEMVFRGVMQRVLIKMTGNVHWGIIICALIFSLIHFSYFGFLTRFFLGVVLGYIYVSTSNLWYCVWFHFLNNGIAVTFAWITAKGYDMSEWDMIGYSGMAQWIGLAFLFAVTVFGIMKMRQLIQQDFINEIKEY